MFKALFLYNSNSRVIFNHDCNGLYLPQFIGFVNGVFVCFSLSELDGARLLMSMQAKIQPKKVAYCRHERRQTVCVLTEYYIDIIN